MQPDWIAPPSSCFPGPLLDSPSFGRLARQGGRTYSLVLKVSNLWSLTLSTDLICAVVLRVPKDMTKNMAVSGFICYLLYWILLLSLLHTIDDLLSDKVLDSELNLCEPDGCASLLRFLVLLCKVTVCCVHERVNCILLWRSPISERANSTVSKRVLILRTWGPLGGTENGTLGAQIKILKCLILIRYYHIKIRHLRILIWAPQVPFSVPPRGPQVGFVR